MDLTTRFREKAAQGGFNTLSATQADQGIQIFLNKAKNIVQV